ncbi:MAG TPA: hypothetical protein VNQ56_12855 [Pseudolabrys sp.]|nr:hypothetical protein [Pseudolabrys sp.]
MAIIYPLDILAGFPGTTTRFELQYLQEVSPLRGGRQVVADLGPALWAMDVRSRSLQPNELKAWKARLAALENGGRQLIGYDMTACYPIAYPRGSWPTGGEFDGLASLRSVTGSKTVTLGGLLEGYKVSTGDYISFGYGGNRALHQAMEDAVADEFGVSSAFEVRPYIRPGYVLDVDVALTRPHAVMLIVPGSVSAPSAPDTGRGTVSFSAIQTL